MRPGTEAIREAFEEARKSIEAAYLELEPEPDDTGELLRPLEEEVRRELERHFEDTKKRLEDAENAAVALELRVQRLEKWIYPYVRIQSEAFGSYSSYLSGLMNGEEDSGGEDE